jgi:hypothetical protein
MKSFFAYLELLSTSNSLLLLNITYLIIRGVPFDKVLQLTSGWSGAADSNPENESGMKCGINIETAIGSERKCSALS